MPRKYTVNVRGEVPADIVERVSAMHAAALRHLLPNNEPEPPMHGPPYQCANCGARITSGPERRPDRPAQPGEHLRRAGLPNVTQARELQAQGLYAGPGHYLPWWGVTFVCANCLELWRNTPPLPYD